MKISLFCQIKPIILHHRSSCDYAPGNVNPAPPPHQADPRKSDRKHVCQNPHPAMSFHCQNTPQNIYISTICNVRMMSERHAVVRGSCMVRLTSVIVLKLTWGRGHDSLWQVHYSECSLFCQNNLTMARHCLVSSTMGVWRPKPAKPYLGL